MVRVSAGVPTQSWLLVTWAWLKGCAEALWKLVWDFVYTEVMITVAVLALVAAMVKGQKAYPAGGRPIASRVSLDPSLRPPCN